MKTKLLTVASSLVTAMLLVGCNSSSSSSSDDDNGDSGGGSADVSAVCDASVSLASNGNGVGSAGYDGLRYYRAGNALCAFDTDSGTAFNVDTNSESFMELVVTAFERSGGSLSSHGVVYVADSHIWYADTDSAAGSVSPRQISSEEASEDITQMVLAPDYQDSSKGSLVYNKGAEGWFAAGLSDSSSTDPVAFGDNRVPVGPFYDGDQLTHWIVRDSSDNRLILVAVSDVATEAVELETGVGLVNYVGEFGNSDALLAVGDDFMFLQDGGTGPELSATSGNGSELAGGLSGLGFVTSIALTMDDVIFLALQRDDNAVLLEADAAEDTVEVRFEDQNAGSSAPVLVTANDDKVVMAWSFSLGQEGHSGIVVTDQGGGSTQTILVSDDTIINSPVQGRSGDWVYFNVTDVSDEENPEYSARFFNISDTDDITTLDGAAWTGSTANVDGARTLNYSVDTMVDAVLMIQKQEGESEDKVLAYDALDPDSGSAELGTIPGVTGPTASIAPVQQLIGSPLGMGPGRLFVHGQGTEQTLLYLDTRHTGSLVEIGKVDMDNAVVSVQGGF